MTKQQIEAFKKITPGPWERIGATQIVKFGEDWACIAEASNPRSDNQREGRGHLVERADICNARFDEACANAISIAALPDLLSEREKMIQALRCVWAGVPDSLRKALGSKCESLRSSSIALVAVLPEGLKKVKDVLAEAEGGE